MTGRRPDVTRVYDFADHFREIGVGDTWQSLPQIFKANGRITLGTGKLYHPGLPPNYDGDNSWSPEALDWNYNVTCRELDSPSLASCQGPEFNPVELNGCFSSAYPLPKPVPPTNWTPALTPGEVGGEQRYRQHSGKASPGKWGASGGFGALSYCENIPYQDLNIVRRMGAHFLDFLPRAQPPLTPARIIVRLPARRSTCGWPARRASPSSSASGCALPECRRSVVCEFPAGLSGRFCAQAQTAPALPGAAGVLRQVPGREGQRTCVQDIPERRALSLSSAFALSATSTRS